jgi:hypothetical protein
MLQLAAIDIPRPLSADNETVITALETAALFGSKGDTLEAVRWLRRAAESAGEAGDDVRALALSRTAADLNEELSAKHSLTTPSPPSLPSVPPPLPSLPPPLPVSAAPRPSAPSTSVAPPASVAPPVSVTPPAPAVAAEAPRPTSPPPSLRPSYPTPPSARSGYRHTTPPSSQMPVARPSSGPHATRVAIHRSPSAAGVFEVRVLAEGEAAHPGDSEAFLVMIDPTSTLLSTH